MTDRNDSHRRPAHAANASRSDDPFAPEVVRAVVVHMNHDHPHDCLAICAAAMGADPHAPAELPALERAVLETYDADGARFKVSSSAGISDVVIRWTRRPLRTRRDVRDAFVSLVTDAQEPA